MGGRTVTTADKVIRAVTALVVVALGGIAAYVSYTHALEVAQAHGEAGASGRLLPLTIDGLVFVASMVMLDSARRGGRTPRLAGFALGAGIGATVAVNVVHGVTHGPVGAAISAWPAVTLVLVVELLMGMIRRGRATPLDTAADVPAARVEAVEVMAEPMTTPTPNAGLAELEIGNDIDTPDRGETAGRASEVGLASAVRSAHAAGWTKTAIGEEFGLSRYKVNRMLDEPSMVTSAALNGDRSDTSETE